MSDPDIREASTDLRSGVKLHYAEAGDQQAARSLVLLHGYSDSWRSFALVLPLLAPLGRVIAVDLRGHGDSSAPAGDYTLSRLAADVVELMDRIGIAKATLMGHSMGSFVARRAALDHPRRVDRMVLIGTAPTADNAVLQELRDAVASFGEEGAPEDFLVAFQESCVRRPSLLPEGFLRSCIEASRRVPLHVWRAALDGLMSDDQTGRLNELDHSILMLGGRYDSVFSVAEQEAASRMLKGARLRIYRHSGHTPHWEEPGRVAEDVEDFLEEGR